MKRFSNLFFFLVFISSNSMADTLILSGRLQLEYPDPKLISHTQNELIVKFKDESFVHEIVDPERMYSQIDLTGLEESYIQSLFDAEARKTLPKWLAQLSAEQSSQLGIGNGRVVKRQVGKAHLLAVYDLERQTGHVYIIDTPVIHRIAAYGTENFFDGLINSIKER